MSALSALLTSPPADAVIEVSAEAVSTATLTARGSDVVIQSFGSEPLPAGAVVPSLVASNVIDRTAVRETLRAAIARLSPRPRRVALLIPDVAGRVSMVRFDKVNPRQDYLDQLVRWQLKKAAPFPVDDAMLTYVPVSGAAENGREFLAVIARRDVIRSYETVCEELDMHPGLVDLTTFGVVGLCVTADRAIVSGDRLLVQIRPEYTSLAILRGGSVIFFRTLTAEDTEALVDVVHQTTMYYQDRLAGAGFSRVLIGGFGQVPGVVEKARGNLEQRLGIPAQTVESLRPATFADRIAATPELLARLAPLVGVWMRMRAEVARA